VATRAEVEERETVTGCRHGWSRWKDCRSSLAHKWSYTRCACLRDWGGCGGGALASGCAWCDGPRRGAGCNAVHRVQGVGCMGEDVRVYSVAQYWKKLYGGRPVQLGATGPKP